MAALASSSITQPEACESSTVEGINSLAVTDSGATVNDLKQAIVYERARISQLKRRFDDIEMSPLEAAEKQAEQDVKEAKNRLRAAEIRTRQAREGFEKRCQIRLQDGHMLELLNHLIRILADKSPSYFVCSAQFGWTDSYKCERVWIQLLESFGVLAEKLVVRMEFIEDSEARQTSQDSTQYYDWDLHSVEVLAPGAAQWVNTPDLSIAAVGEYPVFSTCDVFTLDDVVESARRTTELISNGHRFGHFGIVSLDAFLVKPEMISLQSVQDMISAIQARRS